MGNGLDHWIMEQLEYRCLLSSTPTLSTLIAGLAVRGQLAKHVTIQRLDGREIDPSQPTWILTHGLNSSRNAMLGIGWAIAYQRPRDQILTLDWSEAAGIPLLGGSNGAGLSADDWIQPVAQWAMPALAAYGFSQTHINLNLVGHSWGSYVAAEMAEIANGGVNSIIAIDPGENGLGLFYDPEFPGNSQHEREVDFGRDSRWSWAFYSSHSGGDFGSQTTPMTADESFVVLGTNHSRIRNVFANLLMKKNNVTERFLLENFVNHRPYPYWAPNRYHYSGSYTAGVPWGNHPAGQSFTEDERGYEAVFSTNGERIDGVWFFNRYANPQPAEVFRRVESQLAITELKVSASTTASDAATTSSNAFALRDDSGAVAIAATNTIANQGTNTSAPATVHFYATRNPQQDGVEISLGVRSLASLAAGARSRTTTLFPLSTLPAGFASDGRIFVSMAINAAGTPNSNDLDWEEVLIDPGAQRSDLAPVDLDLDPWQTFYGWGQTVRAAYTFDNKGSGYAQGPFTNAFYLSRDATFDSSDYLLYRETVAGVAAGASIGREVGVTLPVVAPPGYADGTYYVGLVTDDGGAVEESNKANNRGQGEGVDYRTINIAGTPPAPGPPRIGAFSLTPSTLIRGEKVSLAATNVTDDVLVNEVEWFLDSNSSGNLDPGDRWLGVGSKALTTFTSRLPTADWPLGASTIFARAYDNDGQFSLVKAAAITVQGVGPATPDALENNDTPESAHYVGGAGDFTLSNLSITPGDVDWFLFDITPANASLQIDLNFTQESYRGPGVPVGDLDLEMYRLGTQNNLGSPPSSSAGNGHESITKPVFGSGRYVIGVRGAASWEQNDVYTLRIQVRSQAGAPVLGALSASPGPAMKGDNVTLSVNGVSGMSPGPDNGVSFYRDANGNGQIEENEYLGTDWGNPDGGGGKYQIAVSTSNWPSGTSNVMAFAHPVSGPSTLASVLTVSVIANRAPSIGAVVAPTEVAIGDEILLEAQDVSDDQSVREVIFYLDSNANGALDGGDAQLGAGTSIGGGDWSLSVPTEGWPAQTARFFVTASDHRGAAGEALAAVVSVDPAPPTIGSVVGPGGVRHGESVTLTATQVASAATQVQFYLDSNFDGLLDAQDLSLGAGSQNGSEWSRTTSTSDWSLGEARIFVKASDGGSPALEEVASFLLSVRESTPPVVQSAEVSGGDDAVDSVVFTFAEPVSNFDVFDLWLTGPGGTEMLNDEQFLTTSDDLVFTVNGLASLTGASGIYLLELRAGGSQIADDAGNLMQADAAVNFIFVSANDLFALPGGVAQVNDVIIADGGRLDVRASGLVIDYQADSRLGGWNGSSYTGISGLLQSGRNEGMWDGSGIITSMADVGDGVMRTLGVGEASDVLGIGGSETALWNGVTVDATSVIVRYTYAGDIDLNGEINGDDYFHLDSNILLNGVVFGYGNGDINLDGELNGDDYFWIDSNYVAANLMGPI